MPSKSDELKKELAGQEWRAHHYLPHFLEVKTRRDELIEFQKKLEAENPIEISLKKTAECLPKGVIEKYPPPVSFAIFEPDAYGDRDYGIVFDLLLQPE